MFFEETDKSDNIVLPQIQLQKHSETMLCRKVQKLIDKNNGF